MLEITIPGGERLCLDHLVADFNGTLACDGLLLPGTGEALCRLADKLLIHVVTADTFGKAKEALVGVPCELVILPSGDQDVAKLRHIEALGASRCVCIGNGRNDRRMLAASALGIVVIQGEGAAVETLLAAKVVVPDIDAALGLLLNPMLLLATLRV